MIPEDLRGKWELARDRAEVLFLADHGGGVPDVLLAVHGLSPDERVDVLRGMGFRVLERYEMPDNGWRPTEPWCRLTNGVAVNLANGFVIRSRSGGRCRK